MVLSPIELHPATWQALQTRRAQLPHALLLAGQGGIGKAELATAFAAALLCEVPDETHWQACGKCLACNWFQQGNHPDFRRLQPEALTAEVIIEEGKKKASQQITIEQVRALDEFLNVGTHRAGLRIILVNPAEAMNRNTANALLKSLEEPPAGTLFILVSGEPNRLLPTIRSRCQQVNVPTPTRSLAIRYLQQADVPAAAQWLALAGGAPHLAAALASRDQGGWLPDLIGTLEKGAQVDALQAAGQLDKRLRDSKGQVTLTQYMDIVSKWMVDLNFAVNALPARYFLDQQGTITKLAAMIPPTRALRAYRSVTGLRRESEQPLNAKLFLERFFLDYRALFADDRP